MIAKLNIENFELRQKEREYTILNSKLLDMEHQIKLLQEEKARMDVDAREREDLQYRKNVNIQEELQRVNGSILDLEKQARDLASNLNVHKTLVEDKNAEIAKLKSEIAEIDGENARIARDKRNAEADLSVMKNGHRAAKDETDSLFVQNEKLKKDQSLSQSHLYESEIEVQKLNKRIEDTQIELDYIRSQSFKKEKDIELAREGKKLNQAEADSLLIKNNRLQDEKADLLKNIKNLELDIKIASQKLDDALVAVESKDKDLKAVRTGSIYAETREFKTSEEIKRYKKDNETLQILLDKYRKDSEIQKKLRDEEAMRKYQLEDEKKKLSRDALLKDIEARTAKKELEKVQESHERLLDERVQISQELDAVKEHTDLLEYQNRTVRTLCNNRV